MIVKPDKVHVHKFVKTTDQKVLVTLGRKSAIDMIKRRKCKCGKYESYDLERTIV